MSAAAGRAAGLTPAGTLSGADPVPARERGRTTVSDRARDRVATAAARESFAGAVGAPAPQPPDASVQLRGGRARVALRVALPYPVDGGAACDALGERVRARTAELGGSPVSRVDVLVTGLDTPAAGRGRRGRRRDRRLS